MSSTWLKSALVAGSAALISLAVVPALAQPEEVQPPPAEHAGPAEVPPAAPGAERQSKPQVTADTPRELRLRTAKPPARCRSVADTREEAVAYCAPILQCESGTTTVCNYRPNTRDWICQCKATGGAQRGE